MKWEWMVCPSCALLRAKGVPNLPGCLKCWGTGAPFELAVEAEDPIQNLQPKIRFFFNAITYSTLWWRVAPVYDTNRSNLPVAPVA